MQLSKLLSVVGIVLCLLAVNSAQAEETLRVGIKPSEPWVMYDAAAPVEQRQPRGFSIDLWNAIARQLGVKTEWVYFDTIPDLVKAAENDQIDAGISAITVTSERENRVDFSASMFELGLRIMVPADARPNPWLVAMQELAKLFTWQVALVVLGLVLFFAHLRWLVDRQGNAQEANFAADYRHGIVEAVWWALTLFITWDTPHRRGMARVIDLIWFLMGFLCLGILSSVITAALTAQNIAGSINSVNDLYDKKVAAVATDAPRDYLTKLGINVIPVADLKEGLTKVANKEVDALVHDGPRLLYLASQYNKKAPKGKEVNVLATSFNPQIYGIAFPQRSEWLEPVNKALLSLRETKETRESVYESLHKQWLAQ